MMPALVAGVTAYLLAYASQIGNKATTYWLCDLAIMILLFYGLLETLFVFATSVHVPGLLKEHYLQARKCRPTSPPMHHNPRPSWRSLRPVLNTF